jgi:hypothetical protein
MSLATTQMLEGEIYWEVYVSYLKEYNVWENEFNSLECAAYIYVESLVRSG